MAYQSREFFHTGRQIQLPPMSSFLCNSPSYANCSAVGAKGISKPMEGQSHHHRCASESVLIEEQPSWLEELLNEPDTLVHKGHRRSASDSSAYLDAAVETFNVREEYKFKNSTAGPSWSSHNFVHYEDTKTVSFDGKSCSFDKQLNRVWESSSNSMNCPHGLPFNKDGITRSGSTNAPLAELVLSTASEKNDRVKSGSLNSDSSGGRSGCSEAKTSASKAETKRAKQQSARRSRVRKLQYIAELERIIHVLQAEGSEVSAQLEFLDQQNLILGMESRALRQHLDSLSQEQRIKHLEQEMLERELGRLQTLYQQQQRQQQLQQQVQRQQQHSKHRHAKSRELESQFANLSIKNKEAGSRSGSATGSVHI